ncbi:MAG TPA: MarR family transcriptional regulator [Spirochaetota bacterium]|jgi:DNA-binding MarR family transcriptional regulator|nr:MarR family transcriptional regulator [Spirochaetota bacterium]OQA99884.1 MAG: putative HTH-type transcriptional regulator YusO [Spirochaetes bacterium ADurb.Bin218]HOK01127.1 MarR family transcriptional regulator [Spirochaetota bacterium]HOK92375.1 MarR family transcriptional regulator [Spirochaetota bacterium]HOQ12208.1 MarR family transcriptional regulator [Spirochaetota bacterium]
MRIYLKRKFLDAGLKTSPGQLGVLFILKKDGLCSMSYLSNLLEADNSSITRTVDRLEKSGLAKRVLNEKDRREFHVEITAEGIKETLKAKSVIASANKFIEENISAEKLMIFAEVLDSLNKLLRDEKGKS